jgi:hypothetical protein
MRFFSEALVVTDFNSNGHEVSEMVLAKLMRVLPQDTASIFTSCDRARLVDSRKLISISTEASKQESIYCIDLPLQTAQLVLVSTIYLFMSISRLEVNWRSSCCRLDCFDLVIVYPVSLQYTVWP